MAYITKYNFNKVFSDRYVESEYPESHWLDRIKGFYAMSELQRLYAYEVFVKDPVMFCKQHGINFKDTYTYVYENPPAYHVNNNCTSLNKDFTGKGAIVPQEIRQQGYNAVKEYRRFYRQNLYIHDTDKKTFFNMVNEKFVTNISDEKFDTDNKPNSGVSKNINNLTLEQLRWLIAKKIDALLKLRNHNKITKVVCNTMADKSYIVKYGPQIMFSNNNTSYDNEIVFKILKVVHRCKQNIMDNVKLYLYKKYDPNQGDGLDKPFLEALGFKPCPYCFKK